LSTLNYPRRAVLIEIDRWRTIARVSGSRDSLQIREIDGRSQAKGGAPRNASQMREEAAPGPLMLASASKAPGRLVREDARTRAGRTL
jgi:hypothetical protein